MHFKMSSTICLNLDQSKILSSGKRSICHLQICLQMLLMWTSLKFVSVKSTVHGLFAIEWWLVSLRASTKKVHVQITQLLKQKFKLDWYPLL